MSYNSHKIVGMVSNKGQIMGELAAAIAKSMYYYNYSNTFVL